MSCLPFVSRLHFVICLPFVIRLPLVPRSARPC